RELEAPERLPEAERLAVHLRAALALVGLDHLLARADAPRRQRRAEAPRARAQPAQVLDRVAHVDELPVEDRAQPALVEDDVADAEVAVYDGDARGRGRAREQPALGQLEHRVRLGRELAQRLRRALDLGARGRAAFGRARERGEVGMREVERVDARELRAELRGQRGARGGVALLAQ